MDCLFVPHGDDAIRCLVCGTVKRRRGPLEHNHRNCQARTALPEQRDVEPVGEEVHRLLAALGIYDAADCGCRDKMRIMNSWGVAGCRQNRATIVAWLRESAAQRSWVERLCAGVELLGQPWFFPFDPIGSLVDEAIRRAEMSSHTRAAGRIPETDLPRPAAAAPDTP